MSKKKDLAGALLAQEDAVTGREVRDSDASREVDKPKTKGRSGLVNIAGWFPIKVKFELEELRLAQSRQTGRKITLYQIQAEAYNDLFKKYGRPEVAPFG